MSSHGRGGKRKSESEDASPAAAKQKTAAQVRVEESNVQQKWLKKGSGQISDSVKEIKIKIETEPDYVPVKKVKEKETDMDIKTDLNETKLVTQAHVKVEEHKPIEQEVREAPVKESRKRTGISRKKPKDSNPIDSTSSSIGKTKAEWRFKLLFPCTGCSKIYKSKSTYENHLKSTHLAVTSGEVSVAAEVIRMVLRFGRIVED